MYRKTTRPARVDDRISPSKRHPLSVFFYQPGPAVLLLLVLVFLLAAPLGAQVARYGVFELELAASGTYANPFTGVEVQAQVTGPGGQRTVRGFHDGGSKWRVRYLAIEQGTHSYATTSADSGLGGKTGTFVVGPPAAADPFSMHGPVHIHAQERHSVAHADGTPFLWNGDTEWFFLTHVSSKISQAQRLAAIDFLASKKVNNLLMCMVNSDAGFSTWPWPGTSTPSNRTSFDLARLRQWEEVVTYMRGKGLVADLWFYSDDSTAVMPSALSTEEDLYFRYMLARFGAFPNVTWNLALEYSEYRNAAWVTNRAVLVKAERPGAFLSVHQAPSDVYDFPGNPNLDHTSLQGFQTHDPLNAAVRTNRTLTANAGRPIPICHEEYAIEGANNPDPNVQRRDCWAILLGGGYPKGASLGFWIGTPYASGQHFDFQRIAFETVSKCEWWRMTPQNALVQNGGTGRYALASAEEILAYSVSGATWTLNLAAYAGTLQVEYVNPLTGATQAGSLQGGGTRTITNPFGSGELALRVGGSSAPANAAPVVQDSAVSTPQDTPLLVQLVFSDPDGPGPYAFEIVTQPAHGALSGTGNDRTYTPAAGFSGSDSFVWRVSDGLATSANATVAITVQPPASGVPAWPDAAAVTGVAVKLRWEDNSDNETNFHVERLDGGEEAPAPVPGQIALVSYAGSNTPPTVVTTGANVFQAASRVVNDRTENWTSVPLGLTGLPRLLCARNDRMQGPKGAMYVVSLPAATTVYLPLDNRYAGAKLSWMGAEWTTSGLSCASSARPWAIWQRTAGPGSVSFGTDEKEFDGMCFVFDVSEDPQPPPSGWAEVGVVAAGVVEFIDAIEPNREYRYRVRASNAAGFSAYSNEVSVTTSATP